MPMVYKQMLIVRSRNVPEYYVVGHDEPESLYDTSLLQNGRETISLLFAGFGDARHLHATFASLVSDTAGGLLPLDKRLHVTIFDIKPAVIARDILVYNHLKEFAGVARCNDEAAENKIKISTIPLLYYLYLSPIMPALLHTQLQKNIDRLIKALENPSLSGKDLVVPQMYKSEVLRILREWKQEAGDKYPTALVRKEAIKQLAEDREKRVRAKLHVVDIPSGCGKESAFYHKTGVLVMSWAGHEKLHEDELHEAYSKFDPNNPDRLGADFLRVIDRSWKTNPTFVDLEW